MSVHGFGSWQGQADTQVTDKVTVLRYAQWLCCPQPALIQRNQTKFNLACRAAFRKLWQLRGISEICGGDRRDSWGGNPVSQPDINSPCELRLSGTNGIWEPPGLGSWSARRNRVSWSQIQKFKFEESLKNTMQVPKLFLWIYSLKCVAFYSFQTKLMMFSSQTLQSRDYLRIDHGVMCWLVSNNSWDVIGLFNDSERSL